MAKKKLYMNQEEPTIKKNLALLKELNSELRQTCPELYQYRSYSSKTIVKKLKNLKNKLFIFDLSKFYRILRPHLIML